MDFTESKEKYFIIIEGEERATIRDSLVQAVKKKKQLEKHSSGKRIYIYKSTLKHF